MKAVYSGKVSDSKSFELENEHVYLITYRTNAINSGEIDGHIHVAIALAMKELVMTHTITSTPYVSVSLDGLTITLSFSSMGVLVVRDLS